LSSKQLHQAGLRAVPVPSAGDSDASLANPDARLLDWLIPILGDESPAATDLARSIELAPGRITRAFTELLSGYRADPAAILKPTRMLEPGERASTVLVEGIDFISLCPHHFLPYFGTASVQYEPGTMIVGLGKLPRLVHTLSRRLQIQEDLTREIADSLLKYGGAQSARVSLRARHLCVCYRGPAAVSAETDTTFVSTAAMVEE
jgi:GTP cyclohydrolase I